MSKTVLFVPGSLRKASSARAVMRALADRLDSRMQVSLADPGALPHYNADVQDNFDVDAFIDSVRTADIVVFVTPEYNYSIPGVLKNAIDWASRPAYASVFKGKPCFVISTSGGALGGVRAQAHLKYVLNGMLAHVIPGKEVVVPQANAKTEDGVFTDTAILDFAEAAIMEYAGSAA